MLKVDTHWSFWAKVQAALGVLFRMVILILVLKCYFTCQQSRTQELAWQEMGELRETQAHLTTQLVATQGRAEMTEERLTHRMRSSSLERRKLELARTRPAHAPAPWACWQRVVEMKRKRPVKRSQRWRGRTRR